MGEDADVDGVSAFLRTCIGLVGLGMLGWAISSALWLLRLHRRGVRTSGLVLRWIKTIDSLDGGETWQPRICFETPAGPHEFTSRNGMGCRLYPEGASLPVIYDPADPARAERAAAYVWLGPIVLLLLGAATLVAAFGLPWAR